MKKDNFDYSLAFFIFLIMIASCVGIAGAQEYVPHDNYLMKQALWFVVSIGVVLLIFLFDFDQIYKLTPIVYSIGIVLLIIVRLAPESIAPEINGAKSWFVFPGIGSLQPSEFMKIFLILMLARTILRHSETYNLGDYYSDFKLLAKISLVSGLPMILVLLQNDFGTTLVMFVITIGIVFISGINWRIIAASVTLIVGIIGILALAYMKNPELLLNLMDQYQLNRIYAWLDPFNYAQGIGYQLKQSILAIGSGTLDGKGLLKNNIYVPESHTDFIFAMIGGQFGFIGTSIVITLYFFVIYRIISIAFDNQAEVFNSIICIGMISLIVFHVFQNIGMVIGLIPITGIPLPLMSYGGSSVLATMAGLGLVLNISLKKKNYMFD